MKVVKVLVIEVVFENGKKEQFFQSVYGLEKHTLSDSARGINAARALAKADSVNFGVVNVGLRQFLALLCGRARVDLGPRGHLIIKERR